MIKFLSLLFILIYITACSHHTVVKSHTESTNESFSSHQKNSEINISKNGLERIYTQAIAEFIKAAYKKDKTLFDTLYFGKRDYGQADDFPDIELPRIIENTQIRLINPEEGQNKQTEQKSMVYVNMIGWVENENAEFIMVVFKNGGEHQYDYFINFDAKTSSSTFVLDKIEFVNYLHLNGQAPKRTIIYADGKYVKDQ